MEEEFVDYYKVLELQQTSDEKEIRKAYKTMVKKLHPDLNKAEDAALQFHKMQQAYNIISNQNTKLAFDELLNSRKRKVERDSKMDNKRKLQKEDLLERERNSKKQKQEEYFAKQKLEKEIEKLREDSLKARKKKSNPTFSNKETFQKTETEEIYLVNVRWSKKSFKNTQKAQYSRSQISELFGEYGDVVSIYGEAPSFFVAYRDVVSANRSTILHQKRPLPNFPKLKVYFTSTEQPSSPSNKDSQQTSSSSFQQKGKEKDFKFPPLQESELVRNRFASHTLFERSVLQNLIDLSVTN